MHVCMMHVFMMRQMTHVSMILDPDTCMYDSYPILIHMRDYDAHMYDAFIHDA